MDDKNIRAIGMLLWNYISGHPDCTRKDMYAEFNVFAPKEIRKVLKLYDGIHWNSSKIVRLTEDGYRTTYHYRLVDKQLSDSQSG